jgi:hypothetical protein
MIKFYDVKTKELIQSFYGKINLMSVGETIEINIMNDEETYQYIGQIIRIRKVINVKYGNLQDINIHVYCAECREKEE